MIHAIYKTTIAILLVGLASSEAVNVTVEWDPALTTVDGGSLENIHCYKVFYSDTSGVYSNYVVVTNGTSAQLTGLEYNKNHYFAVKTCTDEAESAFSEELIWTAPVMADEDSDGLSDEWETLHFGALNLADSISDCDGNGVCDLTEFVAGTDPMDPADHPLIELSADHKLFFQARPAAGSGYQNRTRTYRLMYCRDLSKDDWSPVPDMDAIHAEGQFVSYDLSANEASGYYRTEICLN
jgi:hypothetical protein